MRKKILRKPGGPGYPPYVCLKCGTYAMEDSNTKKQQYMEFRLMHCGICKEIQQVVEPRDFGWPTFYTYENGAPVIGSNK